ncbi:MAG: Na+/H+ antiporter NhaA [Alphaproteobacteria bacterium]
MQPATAPKNNPYKNAFIYVQKFFQMSAAGGIFLAISAVVALIVANSSLYPYYDYFLHDITFRIGFDDINDTFDHEIRKPLLLWINDGFMAIFFLLVGLEIKREVVSGELSTRSRALLPAIAAVGGMVVPALIYAYINWDSPENLRGWAIPAATDIAFALGILSLLGTRAPIRLKVLLTAIAIIDDIGAILIIAVFYTAEIAFVPMVFAYAALVVMFMMNNRGVSNIAPYILVGTILWVAVLKTGVHATLAGVVTAFFIPMTCPRDKNYSPLKDLEHALHPWVAFFILPLFAFANAGVPFHDVSFKSFLDPVTLGIILGLVIGKQVGIFSLLWLCIKLGISPMIKGLSWIHLYAVSVLCGVGFTMSLFIGMLAFEDIEHQAAIRLGVLSGSMISAVLGYLLIYYAPQAQDPEPGEDVESEPAKKEAKA